MLKVLALGDRRRAAYPRLCHLLLELNRRLTVVGECDGESFLFPLTHTLSADALGLSQMHLLRTLRQLRKGGLAVWQNGQLRPLDRAGLCRVSGFDEDYLHLKASLVEYKRTPS